MVSFTGSPDVGWKLKQQSGKKKVTLELGGNAACIIDHDADIQDATARLIITRSINQARVVSGSNESSHIKTSIPNSKRASWKQYQS